MPLNLKSKAVTKLSKERQVEKRDRLKARSLCQTVSQVVNRKEKFLKEIKCATPGKDTK